VLGSYRDSQTQMLIRALKGGDSNLEFTLLAEALVQRRLSSPMTLPQGEVTVVPCPSRRTGMKDHAACLALTICALTGWKYSNILQFQGLEKETQKQKKANNRRERRFLLAESIILPVGTLIFVDDLLTTGSTAEAAWVALKRPQQFEVWCIAYQPKLAITKAI
jgi:predicted amidophosphoribosyltransferase